MKNIELLNEIWHIRFSCLPFSKEQGTLSKGSLLKTLNRIYQCPRDIYPYNHIPFFYKRFGHESFKTLLSNPREIQKREYISTPVNRVRGVWGTRAINKIIKTPGKDIRQKIGNAKNVDISKSVYTNNSLENQALVECVRKLLPLLKERDDLDKDFRELKRFFKKSLLEELPEMRTKQPNSKLMYDVHYRKIWKIYNWLLRIESSKKRDEENIVKLVSETIFLKTLSRLVYDYNLVIPEEVTDFGKELHTSVTLLSFSDNAYSNIIFKTTIKDNVIELELNNLKLELEISDTVLLADSSVDELIKMAVIEFNSESEKVTSNDNSFLIPYVNVDKDSYYFSYFENGLIMEPQRPYALKHIDSAEPFSLIYDSTKKTRLKSLQNIKADTVTLIADSIESDNFYDLTNEQIPMSVAIGLDRIEKLDVGESITFLNYLSNPVTRTKLTVRIDRQTKVKYFLRSIPEEFPELKSINIIFNELSKNLGLNYSAEINNSIIEYLLKYNNLFLYSHSLGLWEEYLKPIIPNIKEVECDVIITHPLLSKNNLNNYFDNGVREYSFRSKNNIPIWKEEVISFEMYLADISIHQIKKLTLVDENNTTIDPIRGKKQFISKDNLFFTIPGKKDRAVIPLLYNKDSIKFAIVKLDPPLERDLETKINLCFIYGEKEPYKLSFINYSNKEYKAELLETIDTLEDTEVPECPSIDVGLKEIKKTSKSKLKFFSPNYNVDDSIVDILDDIADEESVKFNERTAEQQNKDTSFCKLGEWVPDDYWDSLLDEVSNYSHRSYKIRRRYAVAMSPRFRDVFIKRLIEDRSPSKFDDLWGLSYAVWYNQNLISDYFDSYDKCDYLYKLMDLIVEGFDYVKKVLEDSVDISNFPSLLLLGLLKLSRSNSQQIKEIVSLSNPKMQRLLFRMYNYDNEIRETRKQLNNKGKEILYSDGFDIELNGSMDSVIEGMEKHNYLIHKFLNGDKPLISVDIKG